MIIAIASGKGGTGKTTVSVNLAKVFGKGVQLIDCDVEEPNAHLFLASQSVSQEVVNIKTPQINLAKCNACGDCSSFCEFNAIVVAGQSAMVFPDLCHGCGGCALVCTKRAISEVDSRVGVVEIKQAGDIVLVQGKMDVGVSSASPLIDAVKQRINPDGIALLDAPPGTSCPAVATLRGADYAVFVTEPTPFGLHDLRLAVAVARKIGIRFGVVVNRFGIGDDRIHLYCRDEDIPLLLEIPDDRGIAEAYSRGEVLVDALPQYRALFAELRDKLMRIQRGA